VETLIFVLIILFGLIGFLSPCTWNLNVILIANAKKKGWMEIFYFFFFRIFLFIILGILIYFLGFLIKLTLNQLIIVHFAVAGIFFFGNPLMKKMKIASFDLSLQALLPKINVSAGIAIGLNFPYCAFPYFILVGSYGIYLGGFYPVIFAVLFAVISGIPTFLSYFMPEKSLKKINESIPTIPYITGFMVLIVALYLINQNIFSLFSLFDFVNKEHSLWIVLIVSFALGILTNTGPSTLPFLPVVAGILVSKVNSKSEIFRNVFAFVLAFIVSHILIAVVAFYGFMVINELFNVQLFSIILGLLLLFLGFNFIGFLNISVKLPKIKFIQNKSFINSFLLGIVYTFSICPSCTGFLLGTVTLSVATKNIILTIFVMVVYAIGRSIIIFLLGFLFNIKSVQQFIAHNYIIAKRITGVIFLILAIYFIQKGF